MARRAGKRRFEVCLRCREVRISPNRHPGRNDRGHATSQPLNLASPLPHPLRETWPEKASILKQRKGSTSRRPVARKGEQGIMGRAICGCVRCVGFGQVPQIQMWFGDGVRAIAAAPPLAPKLSCRQHYREEEKGQVSRAANGKRERSRQSTSSQEGVRRQQTHCTPCAYGVSHRSPFSSRSGWAFDSASSAVQAVTVSGSLVLLPVIPP